jgi:hypothetical protein
MPFIPLRHDDLIASLEDTFLPACRDLEAKAILLYTDNGRFFCLLDFIFSAPLLFLCPKGGTPFIPRRNVGGLQAMLGVPSVIMRCQCFS